MSILLLISILPIYLIGSWIYKNDQEKEPKELLTKLFLGGIGAIFLTLALSSLLEVIFPVLNTPIEEFSNLSDLELIFMAFIGVALLEEFSKWFMTYKISYNHKEFDEQFDMILYASFVSLGFACLENIIYVLSYGIMTGITRAISSIPSHACDGILMGYYLGLAKKSQLQKSKKNHIKYLILSLLIPILAHGFYDYCLFSSHIELLALLLLFLITLYRYSFKKVKLIANLPRKLKYQNKYCPICGHQINGNFCPNCGRKNE